jgi:hypothetical protein
MAWVVARRLLEINPHDDSAYAIVANMLSIANRWDDVVEVREMMKDRRVKKEGGGSWIEVWGKVHCSASAIAFQNPFIKKKKKKTKLLEN